MTAPIVVGLTGYAQHGKDTVGNRLVERWGFKRFAFADVLKSLALTLNPLVPAWDDETEEQLRLTDMVERFTWEGAKQMGEVRRFLQVLGTEGVRGHLGDDTWVRACGTAIYDSGVERAVITDARFPNEFRYVQREMRGKLVRVTRYDQVLVKDPEAPNGVRIDLELFDNGVGKSHPSEMHVEKAPADFNIVSLSGDMADLLAKADAVAADIVEGF